MIFHIKLLAFAFLNCAVRLKKGLNDGAACGHGTIQVSLLHFVSVCFCLEATAPLKRTRHKYGLWHIQELSIAWELNPSKYFTVDCSDMITVQLNRPNSARFRMLMMKTMTLLHLKAKGKWIISEKKN